MFSKSLVQGPNFCLAPSNFSKAQSMVFCLSQITNGNFTWDKGSSIPIISDINTEIPAGTNVKYYQSRPQRRKKTDLDLKSTNKYNMIFILDQLQYDGIVDLIMKISQNFDLQ